MMELDSFGVIHKPRGQIFGYFWPPPPSWSFLLNKAYDIKWSFGYLMANPTSPSTVNVVYVWPFLGFTTRCSPRTASRFSYKIPQQNCPSKSWNFAIKGGAYHIQRTFETSSVCSDLDLEKEERKIATADAVIFFSQILSDSRFCAKCDLWKLNLMFTVGNLGRKSNPRVSRVGKSTILTKMIWIRMQTFKCRLSPFYYSVKNQILL